MLSRLCLVWLVGAWGAGSLVGAVISEQVVQHIEDQRTQRCEDSRSHRSLDLSRSSTPPCRSAALLKPGTCMCLTIFSLVVSLGRRTAAWLMAEDTPHSHGWHPVPPQSTLSPYFWPRLLMPIPCWPLSPHARAAVLLTAPKNGTQTWWFFNQEALFCPSCPPCISTSLNPARAPKPSPDITFLHVIFPTPNFS